MARTIVEIKKAMTDSFIQNESMKSLYNLTPGRTFEEEFSAYSLESILFYSVAYCIWVMEKLVDFHYAEVNELISKLKPHTLRWYAEKARAFQYGHDLVAESDYYDNTGLTDQVVEDSKIIAYAAVVEQIRGLRIKVARNVGADLGPLEVAQLDAFVSYMKRVKDAGVKLMITSAAADNLLLKLTIKYDPLILKSTGERIDGQTLTPVKDAIKSHLKNLPFNGVFSVQKLVDTLQAVEGVVDLSVLAVQTQYGALPFTTVNISVIPDAGYLRIDDANLTINYLPSE